MCAIRPGCAQRDKIYTIVRQAIETAYKTDDAAIRAKEGQLLPLYCDDHPEVIKRLGGADP